MRVIGLHVFSHAVFFIGVEHDNNVAPAGSASSREQHPPIGDRVNRVAQIAVFTTDAVQIVAKMPILGKRLRVVGERAVFIPSGKSKRAAVGRDDKKSGDTS